MSVKQIAQKILDRDIKSHEGLDILEIEKVEKRLKIVLPKELKELYLTLGKNELFMQGYQRFLDLEKLVIKNNKLVFLEENQYACYWGVDLEDEKNIYQANDMRFKKCHKEEFNLDKFIEMILYFQCVMADDEFHESAKSGFGYFALLDINDCEEKEEFLKHLQAKFTKELIGNGVSIFSNQDTIFLILLDKYGKMEQLFTCCKDEVYFDNLIEKYCFMEL
ncbi:MAG: hypothetical protein KGV43_03685 [Arcobacter sp.]|nr:hypothetical protein [Arcobacter sp.]